MKPDPEQTLRTLRWSDPPPEFLARVLDDARRERRKVVRSFSSDDTQQTTPTSHRLKPLTTLLTIIPRPLRIPLAACWLLALFFRVTTPEAIPAATLENYARLPPVTPEQLLAQIAEAERLAHELAEQLHGPIPPL